MRNLMILAVLALPVTAIANEHDLLGITTTINETSSDVKELKSEVADLKIQLEAVLEKLDSVKCKCAEVAKTAKVKSEQCDCSDCECPECNCSIAKTTKAKTVKSVEPVITYEYTEQPTVRYYNGYSKPARRSGGFFRVRGATRSCGPGGCQ